MDLVCVLWIVAIYVGRVAVESCWTDIYYANMKHIN